MPSDPLPHDIFSSTYFYSFINNLAGMSIESTSSRNFPPITECDVSEIGGNKSIAADLDGTLLISARSLPYFMLVATQAGSLFRGLLLLLSFPVVAVTYLFFSEALGIKILIYISFAGLKIRDIEQASRVVLPRFYATDVRKESWELFKRCERKVVVTANPIIMVEPFVTDFLGGDKVLGTEIELDPRTNRATGHVSGPGVLVSEHKRVAIEKEFGAERPDFGIGDRKTDHDFMSFCKKGYMVPPNKSAMPVSVEELEMSPINFHNNHRRPTLLNALTYTWHK